MLQRIILIFLLIFRILAASFGMTVENAPDTDVSARLDTTLEYLRENAADAVDTSGISEWTLIALSAGGASDGDIGKAYLDLLTERVRAQVPGKTPLGTLDEHMATENAKAVLALAAIGTEATDIAGYDLTSPLRDVDWLCSATINGPIFALIALGASGTGNADTERVLADHILSRQLEDGGWALSGKRSDPDVTSMALQALVACAERDEDAAQRAIDALSEMQQDNGGYRSFGRENSESVAQVMIALCDWGIDPRKDERFIKNGQTLLDVLMGFSAPDGGFYDTPDQSDASSPMATEQAALALAAIERLDRNDGRALYSFK